jgi:hypothetical protein
MLQAGKQVTQLNDPMQKLNVDQLFRALTNPKPSIRDSIQQLRILQTIDTKKYSLKKRTLPYITCGIFNPPFRRTENFASIEVFILDIDHLSEKAMNTDQLKEKLKHDNRILLMFVSPGGDGLKIMFQLSEKCFDHGKYSMFYKVFARAFSQQYDLGQVIDSRTSDVTRACFISLDEDAYYNQECEKVKMDAFIDFNDPFQVLEVEEIAKEETTTLANPPSEKELGDDVLQIIKQKLNPNIKTVKPKNLNVPDELNDIMPKIESHLAGYEIKIHDTKSINYGKQIKCTAGNHFAVINIFYGKNGYKVVATNKSGSNADLADLSRKALCEILY